MLIASGPKTLNETVEKCITMERNIGSDRNIFRIGSKHNQNRYNSNRYNANFNEQRNRNHELRSNDRSSNGYNFNNTSYRGNNLGFNNGNNFSSNPYRGNNSRNVYNDNNRRHNNDVCLLSTTIDTQIVLLQEETVTQPDMVTGIMKGETKGAG